MNGIPFMELEWKLQVDMISAVCIWVRFIKIILVICNTRAVVLNNLSILSILLGHASRSLTSQMIINYNLGGPRSGEKYMA